MIFRAYYAMPALFSPSGEPTGAVYGFVNMLLGILEKHGDATIAVAYDRKEKTFRHEMFPEYKGTRKETDEDLIRQFPVVREMLETLGIPVVECSGYEADDIIGTLAKRAAEEGADAYVYTGDRDALQLVQYGIHVNITLKGVSQIEEYDDAKVLEKLGVTSSQVVDYKSLRGDASDNIPGAKGIGEKTAVRLLAEYGTTENLLTHAAEIRPERISKIIRESEEMILLSKTLATILLDVPVSLEGLPPRYADLSAAKSLFARLGFSSLLKKIDKLTGNVGGADAAKAHDSDDSAASDGDRHEISAVSQRFSASGIEASFHPAAPFAGEDFSVEQEELIIPKEVDSFSFDTPFTLGIDLADDGAWGAFRSAFVMRDGVIRIYREERDFVSLKEILEDPSVKKRIFSSKECYLYCFSKGIRLAGVSSDAVIAAYLTNPSRKSFAAEDLAAEFGYSLEKRSAGRQLSLLGGTVHVDERRELGRWAAVTTRLGETLDRAVERSGMKALYETVELPLVNVLADIEFTGFKVHTEVLREIGAGIEGKIADLERRIHAMAGEVFNISSPKQLGVILFEKLGLPALKKTKTGYSTDKDVLEKLGREYEIAGLIIEYRSYTKLKSNYIDSLQELARGGRIHTSLNQTIAVTGRLSSTEPNLQNIPIRLEEGRGIRRAFVSDEGCVLLDADYSQIELRVLAHMSGDSKLQAAFANDEDIHALTASEVFGVEKEEVTALQRSHAKEVNFGIIYGMGDFGLSESLGIPVFEAKHYIEQYFRTYESVRPFMDGIVEECRKRGYVETLMGRKRLIPELQARNKMVQAHGMRMARNTVIQGTAADIIKIAMVRLYRSLKEKGLRSKLILQIHDELILNVPEEELEEVRVILRESMEQAVELSVPLKVDMQVAKTWYDAK